MGAYRLFLAALVALSHVGFQVFGLNPGVVAVTHFFLLSGFVMTALIRRYYLSLSEVPAFYLDRSLRLQPQYLFYLSVGILYYLIVGIENPTFGKITVTSAALSALIVPTSFITFDHYGGINILAPTWSLGLEACFYLVIPFLLIFRLRMLAMLLSLFVFWMAYSQVISTDLYGYRLLPGTLFMFIVGSYLCDESNMAKIIVASVYFLMCTMFFSTMVFGVHFVPNNPDVLFGLVTAVPAVYFLAKVTSGKIDIFLGNISYGMFLNHWILIWVATEIGVVRWGFFEMATLIISSFFIGWISYHYIERPVISYRRKMRRDRANEPADKPGSVATQ